MPLDDRTCSLRCRCVGSLGLLVVATYLGGCPSPDKEPSARDSEDTGECLAPTLWYQDGDGDGFGSPEAESSWCVAPDGWVADNTDCDDTRATVFPGAAEVCNDGLFNDCDDVDGAVAQAACPVEGPYPTTSGDARFMGEVPGDGAGGIVAGAGDVNGDGKDDLMVGTPFKNPGGVYVVVSPVAGDVPLASADATLTGQLGELAGWSVSGGGDLDDDGYADLLVGATQAEYGGVRVGGVYVVLSPSTGNVLLSDADAALFGGQDDDNAGASVTGLGDVDGDGWDDIVVGAQGTQGSSVESSEGECSAGDEVDELEGGAHAGAAFILQGPVSGTAQLASANATLFGEDGGDNAGNVVAAAGDYNGDGSPDLLVGAPLNCEGGAAAGAAYMVISPIIGELYLGDADLKLVGESSYDFAAKELSSAGDINGDGSPDIVVGTPDKDGREGDGQGTAYLVFGPGTGKVDLGAADVAITGEEAADSLGLSCSSAGDLNVDGFDDLILSAPHHSAEADDDGAVYVMFGPITGLFNMRSADAQIIGATEHAHAGWSIAGVGDADADGASDLLIGVPGDDANGDAGAAYLILGSSPMLNGTFGP